MNAKAIVKKLCNILYPNHTWSDNELYVVIDKKVAKKIWKICEESEENRNEVRNILGEEAYQACKPVPERPRYR